MKIIARLSEMGTTGLESFLWTLCVVCVGVLYPATVASQCPCTFTPAILIEVVDGQTSWFEVDGEEIFVHFEGIEVPALEDTGDETWCPEEGQKALEAREFVIRTLSNSGEILIDLEGKQRRGVVNAEVYVDGLSLGQELLYKYLAVESESGMTNWCH